MGVRSITELNIEGRRVFVRVDFNVPLADGKVSDDARIRATLPTLRHALERGARLVLASHVGRPKGKRKPELSLEPMGARLAELLQCEVLLTEDCVGDAAAKLAGELRDGQLLLLENLRFHGEEEQNDAGFARELRQLCDVYVNDAFGAAHRAHASVSALPALVPDRGIGLLMEKELESLTRLRNDAPRPFVAVLGGAKVSDKIGVLEALLERVDALLIGGAMANTFLAAQGHSMGRSRIEEDKLALARSLITRAQEHKVRLLLPRELVVAQSLDAQSGRPVPVGQVQPDEMALDIGPQSVAAYREVILPAQALFWNGPMGLFENRPFAAGTLGVAQAGADCAGFTVVGGGDSVAAVNVAELGDSYDHVSTGGGASLEFLEGKQLPGVQAVST